MLWRKPSGSGGIHGKTDRQDLDKAVVAGVGSTIARDGAQDRSCGLEGERDSGGGWKQRTQTGWWERVAFKNEDEQEAASSAEPTAGKAPQAAAPSRGAPASTKKRQPSVSASAVCMKRRAVVLPAASLGKDSVDTSSDRRMGLLTHTGISDLFGVSVIRDARQC